MNVTDHTSNKKPGADAGAAQENRSAVNPWDIEAPSPELLESPIEFLFVEHNRQRQAANILHLVADGEVNKAGVKKLIDFLETDFAVHVADEELCFFPLLLQHCPPEDNIDKLIERLADEHKKDEATVTGMTTVLNDVMAGNKLNDKAVRTVRGFAEHILQHLALENAVLLPIARARLNETALCALSDMMKERRI
ncbi:MAG: hemerythrin domain-containing protein [Alphaproteobacteria bacterium]|nr:hemerythrin domain-containing protein [Alphaproteobacteria bacterium]